MNKKKLNLTDLEVRSFVTRLETKQKGGVVAVVLSDEGTGCLTPFMVCSPRPGLCYAPVNTVGSVLTQ